MMTDERNRFTHDGDGVERPEWAAQVLKALDDAGTSGYSQDDADPRLTRGELDILDGIRFRIRERLGEQGKGSTPLGATGDEMVRWGAEQIAAEAAGKPKRRLFERPTTPALIGHGFACAVSVVIAAYALVAGQYVNAAIYAVVAVAYGLLAAAAWKGGRS